MSKLYVYILAASLLFSVTYIQSNAEGQSYPPLNEADFSKWGTEPSELNLSTQTNGTTALFELDGTTGNSSAGYVSRYLSIIPEKVIISVGNVSKYSTDTGNSGENDTQVTIAFQVSGENGLAPIVKYVVGPLSTTGWFRDSIYESINPGSSAVLNLQGLTLSDKYVLKQIAIAVQGNSVVEEMDFALRFE